MRFEIFQRRNGIGIKRWYWRVKAGNHEIIAQSEAYNTHRAAWRTCDLMRSKLTVDTPIIDCV